MLCVVAQTKSSYESKCKEADKSEENFHKIQNTPASKPPEVAKVHDDIKRCYILGYVITIIN